MILRSGAIAVVVLSCSCIASVSSAQQPTSVPRVAYLAAQVMSESAPVLNGLRQGLRDHGHIPSDSVLIEERYADLQFDRLPGLAAELVRLDVNVIVAVTLRAAEAARGATSTIPIVFTFITDPIGAGLVESLARPGGNVTGLTGHPPEVTSRHLQMLKEAVPKMTRLAVLLNPANLVQSTPFLREVEAAAPALRITPVVIEMRGAADLDRAFAEITHKRAHALFVMPDPATYRHRARILELAAKHRLPAVGWRRELAEAGALMTYGVDPIDLARRAGGYVTRILRGAKPSEIPVDQASRFEFVVNLKTAKKLGLTMPQSLMFSATEIIQ